MDKIKKYEAIINYLEDYAAGYANDPSGIQTYVVIDREHLHYQLIRIGWRDKHYLHYMLMHFEIKNKKVWILLNETEDMVGDELISRGIPKLDIVLGFYHESVRPYSGFAVA